MSPSDQPTVRLGTLVALLIVAAVVGAIAFIAELADEADAFDTCEDALYAPAEAP